MSETAQTSAPAAAPATPPPPAPAAPAATPAAPVAPAAPQGLTPEQLARSAAAMAQREIALTREKQRLAAENAAKGKEYETARQKAERLDKLEQLKASDPLAYLKEVGLDYNTITKAQMGSKPDADAAIKKIQELEAKIEAQREQDRRASEEAAKVREANERQASYNHWKAKASDAVNAAKDKYEVLLDSWQELTGASDLGEVILDVIEADYQGRVKAGEKDVKPITVEEAADRANAAAEARAEKIAAAYAKKKAKTPAPAAKVEEKKADAPASAAKPEAEVKTAVDKSAKAPDDSARPVFKPAEESFSDYLDRVRTWERNRA